MTITPSGPRSARRPLVLTGGPAVGKTSTGRAVASARTRAAFIDVDDVRRLVVAGDEPPWRGTEGQMQQTLGVLNACGMARRLMAHGFDVVVADVLTPRTAALYRQESPRCLVVHMAATLEEARRRASTRPMWLTAEEFDLLHAMDSTDPPPSDHRLNVARMSFSRQVRAAEVIWASG